jgi:hypothetical protein
VSFWLNILTSLNPALPTTSFDFSGKRRMANFAEHFPDAAIVSTLSRQLSWIPMVAIVALKTLQVHLLGYWSSDVCGRKLLRPLPKSNRSTAAVHQREEVSVCALVKGGDCK